MESPPPSSRSDAGSSLEHAQPLDRRASKRLSTARRSLLGLFAQMTGEQSIPEGQEPGHETIHIDDTPPRLASLDLPRQEISLTQPPSPSSIRSAGHSAAPAARAPSVRTPSVRTPSVRAPSVRSSIHSIPEGEVPVQAPIPAHIHTHGSVSYVNTATDQVLPDRHPADPMPERHPADPMPERHPADPLPARSISEGSEGSGTSRSSRWRLRRKKARHGRRLPENSLRRRLFPALRYSSVRRKVFHALVTGILMLLVFIVFLALMNTTNDFAQEFRIITVLFMLIFVVLFAHSMIRLIVLLLRLRRNGGLADPDFDDPESYAQVQEPIPVVLARDEELGISGNRAPESDKNIAPPPPAYGRWRGSVRVDPNLIHWERVETNQRPLSEGTIRRPPSYISENDAEEAEASQNNDELNEKPIRPRTPPMMQQHPRQRATVIYDARESWVPQMPQNTGSRGHLTGLGLVPGWVSRNANRHE